MERIAVVTGATSGIGLATVQALAEKGARVLGVGRDAAKCERAESLLRAAVPEAEARYYPCDLSSQAQIRGLGRVLRAAIPRVDILVHAAGCVSSYFMTTEDGIELQFAVNHLAPFLLTHELMGHLAKSEGARMVIVSSSSHYHTRLDFSDLQMRRRYRCLSQYKRVKLCNVLFAAELDRRFSALRSFAMDPGLVRTEIGLKGTGGIEKFVWRLRMKHGVDPSVPADAISFLALDPGMATWRGGYWKDKAPKYPNPRALRREDARTLWEASLRFTGIREYGILDENE
jgi:NAD(P)-dependent dehydrogenase (short-subunit alcohol dehydrogenase family)